MKSIGPLRIAVDDTYGMDVESTGIPKGPVQPLASSEPGSPVPSVARNGELVSSPLPRSLSGIILPRWETWAVDNVTEEEHW